MLDFVSKEHCSVLKSLLLWLNYCGACPGILKPGTFSIDSGSHVSFISILAVKARQSLF